MRSEINGAQIVLGILAAALGTYAAQSGPYRVGNGVTAPQVVKRTEPVYPNEARKAAVDGYVRVTLVVDSEGNPSGLKVSPPLGFGLDEAALQAVASWKFQPGMKDGIAVVVETSVNVAFQLPGQPNALHMQGLACNVPAGAPHPVVIQSPYPSIAAGDSTVSAIISLDVDALGVPHNPRVINLTDARLEESIIAAILKWRFQPSADGRLVASNCTLSFALGKAPPISIGGGVTSPRIITKVEPHYSDEAKSAGYEGTVVLAVIVDDRGKPRDVKIRRGIGMGLDEKAIEAVNQWQFQPGMKDGRPVAVSVIIEVNFVLLKKRATGWHSENLSFSLPGGVTRPQLVRTKFPEATDSAEHSVTLSFEVGEQGSPVNIHVDKSSDENWNQKVVDAVMEWQFEPGTRNGIPAAVPCTVTVRIGN